MRPGPAPRFAPRVILALALVLGAPGALAPAWAQDRDRTLADIRQDLTVLNVEIQRLKRELSTTGGPSMSTGGATPLDRLNAIEAELQRLTSDTEELTHRVERIVEDGTNRIGDLEFRLVELEGGDVSQLSETSTLGGLPAPGAGEGATGGQALAPADGATGGTAGQTGQTGQTGQGTSGTAGGNATLPDTGGVQLAVGERADFDAAAAALEAGEADRAATLFQQFRETYPGSPLEPQALLGRGKALEQAGDQKAAARAYLDAFSGYPEAQIAPEALFRLGRSLGRLGQVEAGCQTLGQVEVRYPSSPFVAEAATARAELSCQ